LVARPLAEQAMPVVQISFGPEFTICTAHLDQVEPAIYGDIVVWGEGWGALPGDIHGYDLSTGQGFTVCTAAGLQADPAIYGSVVVWEDHRGADYDIYGYDLRTGLEFTIFIPCHLIVRQGTIPKQNAS